MSEGESLWPLSWRDRNTTGVPAISPTRSSADGSPHGLLIARCRTFSSPGRSYMPEPPMMPSTALVMAIPVTADWTESQRCDRPVTERRIYFAALVSDRPRARSPARIFARRSRFKLLRMQFHVVPHLLLGEVEQPRKHDQENEHLHADALPGLEVRLGGPHQEGGDVLGILLDRHRRAVGVVDALVRERRRHRDGMAGKIFIVEAAGRKGDARRRRVLVAVQQRGKVVDALLLVLREHIADPAGEAALVTARLGDHR